MNEVGPIMDLAMLVFHFYTLRTETLAKLVPKYLQKPGYANAKHKHVQVIPYIGGN